MEVVLNKPLNNMFYYITEWDGSVSLVKTRVWANADDNLIMSSDKMFVEYMEGEKDVHYVSVEYFLSLNPHIAADIVAEMLGVPETSLIFQRD